MRIHIEGEMSIGFGVTNCIPSRKNLNTKSSTELELFGARNYLPWNMRYIMFMNHKGYLNKSNKFSRTTKAP